MDNLTHTLIGALVAETAVRVIPATRSALPDMTRRCLYMTLMVVGNNLPDMDLLYSGLIGGTLGYLLHHRGHTHTLLGAIVLGMLMYAAALMWLRWRRIQSTRMDRRWLAFMALLAPLLHLGMDATNEYGVHPYWPFNNEWLYGDAIFIVEPLFWAAGAPLVFLLRGRLAKGLMITVLVIAVALGFGSGLVPPPMALAMTLLITGLLAVAWRVSARKAALTGLAAMAGIVCMFVVASSVASRQIATLVAARYPDALVVDQVLAPLPVNPLCWEVILVQLQGDDYTLREAMFSLAPGWMPAVRCSTFALDANTTAVLAPIIDMDSSALAWHAEMKMSVGDLRTLVQNHCEAAAFTIFARALWIMREGNGWLMGDLRYDREPELGFAEIAVQDAPSQCPRNIPPWIPPRSDVLGRMVDDVPI
jgi:inner membrane protein